MRRSFRVELDIPSEAKISDVRDYIYDAVCSWRGQTRPPGSIDDSDPGDPAWHINPDSIIVTRMNK